MLKFLDVRTFTGLYEKICAYVLLNICESKYFSPLTSVRYKLKFHAFKTTHQKSKNLFVQTVFSWNTQGGRVDGGLDKLDISMLYQEAIELCVLLVTMLYPC